MYSDEIGHVTIYAEEEFEDTKGAIRIRISKNIRTWKRVQWSDESYSYCAVETLYFMRET